jgi:Zn-dependent M28 family amino/carboxypeptidase
MNYEEGVKYMISLSSRLANTQTKMHFDVENIRIEYPGYKGGGDYRLTLNGTAPTYASVVRSLYNFVTPINFNQVVDALEDMYLNGLNAKDCIFKQNVKELIYWITLQEEINYPQPEYFGRKLPFQRFYEAILAKLNFCSLEEVISRTNNHGRAQPILLSGIDHRIPSFYK